MSAQNHLINKRLRSRERADRKAKAAKRLSFGGVVVRRGDVLAHRYLAVHGLPFSKAVAAVHISPIVPVAPEGNIDAA